MTRPRYIRHLNLDTGDTRDCRRGEVADDVIAMLRPLLDRAVAGWPDACVPVPGDVRPPGCTLTARKGRGALLVTVCGPRRNGLPVPLVTFGVASCSLANAWLWRKWLQRDDPRPPLPWCAVQLLPGLAVFPEATHWLGDFERCCAWAWIEKRVPGTTP